MPTESENIRRSKRRAADKMPGVDEHAVLLKAETTWFHVFRDMVEFGDVAKIGPHALAVYVVIKAHTNFKTGRAFPAIETVVKKSGISRRQVLRKLSVLEEFGYITKTKQGRKNIYTLREKVNITDGNGRPAAVATWDYLPESVQHAVADLKNVLVSGDLAGARLVHIERLQVNLVTVETGGMNFNVQQMIDNLDKLPASTREILKKRLKVFDDDGCGYPSSIRRHCPANTLAESSRLYSPAIARLTPLTMVDTGDPSFSNCSAQ